VILFFIFLGFFVLMVNLTAPLPRVFHGMLGLNLINDGKSMNWTFSFSRNFTILYERKVTACGYGAIAATMAASKELGATEGKLLKYATSGDVSGDKSSVVGYASIIFT